MAYNSKLKSISATQGNVYYGDGTKVANLSPGVSGQFLKTQGAAANPVWATAGGSTWTIVSVNSTPYSITESSMSFFYANTSSDTFTLPSATGTGKVFKFARIPGTVGTKTIARAGSDQIYNAGTGATSITFTNGVIELIDVATNVWMVT